MGKAMRRHTREVSLESATTGIAQTFLYPLKIFICNIITESKKESKRCCFSQVLVHYFLEWLWVNTHEFRVRPRLHIMLLLHIRAISKPRSKKKKKEINKYNRSMGFNTQFVPRIIIRTLTFEENIQLHK